MNEGYRHGRPPGCVRPLPAARQRPGENLLVWTTTPWTLTQQRRRRRQSGADLPQGQAQGPDLLPRQGRLHGPAAGGAIQDARNGSRACPSSRRWSRSSRKRAATRSSARSRAPTWSAGSTTVPSTNCRPSSIPPAIPTRSPTSSQARVGPGQVGPRAASRRRLEGRRRNRGHRHRPHRAGLRQGRLSAGQGSRACRRSPRWTTTACFVPGFGDLEGKSAVDPATTDCDPRRPAAKRPAVRRREVSAQLSALLALQDRAAVSPGGRVVHQHEHGATRS